MCGDPSRDWHPTRLTCYKTAAHQVAQRMWQSRNENARPDANGFLPDDGVQVTVSEVDPGDDFLGLDGG